MLDVRAEDIPFVRPEDANPMRFLGYVFDAILDRSAEERIGALLIATVVAVLMAGLYQRHTDMPGATCG
jgi:hypothetical protein